MSTYSADLVDVPIEVFGGYCPAIPPADLPPGAASLAQDVTFPMGGLRQRGGLLTIFGPGNAGIPSAATINGLKSYLTPTLAKRLLAWDSQGNFYKENPQGVLTLVATRPYANLGYKSETLFGREYQAFSNSLGGFDIPRQFDDTNWDRVSQSGPGSGPVVSNFLPPAATIAAPGAATVNIAAGPNGIVWGGQKTVFIGYPPQPFTYFTLFTVTTTTAHGLSAGQQVTIAGSTSTPSVNGTWKILTVPSATTFTVSQFAQNPVNGGAGTVGVSTSGVSIIRQGNVATASTAAAHNFQKGWQVQIAGIANASLGGTITAVSRANNIVTITTTSAHGIPVNAQINVTGVANPDASFNGQFTVTAVPSTTTLQYQQVGTSESGTGGGNVQDIFNGNFIITGTPTVTSFTYTNVGPNDSTAGGGTASILGQISAGQHQVSVAFITRQGFITQPSPPILFSAGGGQLAALDQIATGPANVVSRLLLFTPAIIPPATTGSFFSITTSMVIPDNVSTSAIIDFLDSTLISSFQANYLFTQLVLGECASILAYNSRLFWLGERNKVPNFVNIQFDGGFTIIDSLGTLFPNGWTKGANYAGGLAVSKVPSNVKLLGDFQNGYFIVGDGATAIRGQISQSAYQDINGVPIIQPNTSYSVRVRVTQANNLTQGILNLVLSSASQGISATFQIQASQLTTVFQEFSGFLLAPLSAIPSDLIFQVYASGTPNNGGIFVLDSIELYPTNNPFNYSTVRASHAFNPESYDGTTGQIQIRPSDGQQLRAGFPLRNNLYLAKDHYLCYVVDDGVNEPASWAVNEVSGTVGICGPNAVDWMEEWAVFAERSGLYICWGSDPVKITPEIQVDASDTGKISWASINWAAGQSLWVRIDRTNKQILVGAPINGSSVPNVVFVLDYKWLESAQDIASSPLVTYSAFTGKMLAHGRGRRWALWSISASSMCFAERNDGTAQPFFGALGRIQQQFDCALQASDDGTALNAIWQSYQLPSNVEEQMYQLGAHRKLAGFLKFSDKGVGFLFYSISTALRTKTLRIRQLSQTNAADGERPVQMSGERFSITISTQPLSGFGAGGFGPRPFGDLQGTQILGLGMQLFGQGGFGGTVVQGGVPVTGWFQLEKLILCVKRHATMPVRGVSA